MDRRARVLGPIAGAAAVGLVFGLWPAPLWFVLLYVLQFDRRVLTADELQRFDERVAERRRAEETG